MADEDFLCNDEATASNHTSVVVALIVLEGTGFGLGALFIFACCCQLVFIDKLKNLWQIIQFQICLQIFFWAVLIGLGYFISPCKLFALNDLSTFEGFCVATTELHLFVLISLFSWKVIENVYICHLVAKACYRKLNRTESRVPALERLARRRTENSGSGSTFRPTLQRTFSSDLQSDQFLLSTRRRFIKAKEQSREWHISKFSSNPPALWIILLIGYTPGLVIALLSLSSRADVSFPQHQNETVLEQWIHVEGLDAYCWPGPKSNAIWFMITVIPIFIIVAIYIRLLAKRMIRTSYKGANDDKGKSTGSKRYRTHHQPIFVVANWERNVSEIRTSIRSDKFHLKISALTLFITTCSWIIGLLQSVMIWGLAIPHSVVYFLQGFIHLCIFVLRKHLSSIDTLLP